MPDQYFAAQPASAAREHPIRVTLNGGDVTLTTAAGVFSPEHIDTGTQVLLDYAPDPPQTGALLDIGCGWGPIALSLALASPEASVYAVDINARARDLTERNAATLGCTNVRTFAPGDVPADVRFATIWSNPPIRIGKQALHDLLSLWLPRLAPGGEAYLVVQKNLGADSLLGWLRDRFSPEIEFSRDVTKKGFRLIRAVRTTDG